MRRALASCPALRRSDRFAARSKGRGAGPMAAAPMKPTGRAARELLQDTVGARRVCELGRSASRGSRSVRGRRDKGDGHRYLGPSVDVRRADRCRRGETRHHPERRERASDRAEPRPATGTEVRRNCLRREIRGRRSPGLLARRSVAPGGPTLTGSNPQNGMDRFPQASRGSAQACVRPRYTETSVSDGAGLAMRARLGLYARSVPGRSMAPARESGRRIAQCGLGHIVANAAACG